MNMDCLRTDFAPVPRSRIRLWLATGAWLQSSDVEARARRQVPVGSARERRPPATRSQPRTDPIKSDRLPRPVIDQSHTGPNGHDMLHIKAKCRLGSRELACSYCRTQLSSRSGFVMGAALALLPFEQGSADVVSYNEPWKTTAAGQYYVLPQRNALRL